jgi:hypothetical protein
MGGLMVFLMLLPLLKRQLRRLPFARGGAYYLGGGNGWRAGSDRIFVRMPFSVWTRGDNGKRSASIASLSSRASAVVLHRLGLA